MSLAVKSLVVKPTNIIETTPRNTAAVIVFAANPEDVLVIIPSDHIIQNEELYELAMKNAINLAKENNIVTFGINPIKQETRYGWIH